MLVASHSTGPPPTGPPTLQRRRSKRLLTRERPASMHVEMPTARPISMASTGPRSRPVSTFIPDRPLVAAPTAAPITPLDTSDDHDPSLPRRPYPNSYWVTPTLLGSEYPSKGREEQTLARLEALIDVGITDFIDLTEPGERLPGEQYLRPLAEVATRRRFGLLKMTGTDRLDRAQLKFNPNLVHDPRLKQIASAADWQQPQARNVLRYGSFPIPDTTTPDPLTTQAILSALTHSTRQGRRAILHCNGGYGRTGTMIGVWLVFSGYVRDTYEVVPNTYTYAPTPQGGQQLVPYTRMKRAGDYALEHLAKKWKGVEKSRTAPYTPGNAAQMEFVRAFRPPMRSSPPPKPQHTRTGTV